MLIFPRFLFFELVFDFMFPLLWVSCAILVAVSRINSEGMTIESKIDDIDESIKIEEVGDEDLEVFEVSEARCVL